jgi:hypothetical protein
VFGNGQYLPQTTEGRRLLAHELTHVLQQVGRSYMPHYSEIYIPSSNFLVNNVTNNFSTILNPTRINDVQIQRKAIEGGGATPGSGEGIDLIFIIKAEDDPFTADVTKYVKTVLEGQKYIEVDNLDDIFDYLMVNHHSLLETSLEESAPSRPKVRRIRIVSHGQEQIGGVKMTPRSEQKSRFVPPQELVAKYAQDSKVQFIVKHSMTKNAVIEFWGCNIGKVPEAGEAWSHIFGSTFSAPIETFRTGHDEFFRPAENREEGIIIPGRKGRWVPVQNTSEIDARGRNLQIGFRRWLLRVYSELVANGDIVPLKGEQNQVNFMRDLFDRSDGQIKHIAIGESGKLVRPGARTVEKTMESFHIPSLRIHLKRQNK